MTSESMLLDIHNATVFRDNKKIFDGFSLTVEPGQSTAIIGPNGAGKSTLLKLLSRELYPVVKDNSHVRILDQDRPILWELREKNWPGLRRLTARLCARCQWVGSGSLRAAQFYWPVPLSGRNRRPA